jgi:hypothetical protein
MCVSRGHALLVEVRLTLAQLLLVDDAQVLHAVLLAAFEQLVQKRHVLVGASDHERARRLEAKVQPERDAGATGDAIQTRQDNEKSRDTTCARSASACFVQATASRRHTRGVMRSQCVPSPFGGCCARAVRRYSRSSCGNIWLPGQQYLARTDPGLSSKPA